MNPHCPNTSTQISHWGLFESIYTSLNGFSYRKAEFKIGFLKETSLLQSGGTITLETCELRASGSDDPVK